MRPSRLILAMFATVALLAPAWGQEGDEAADARVKRLVPAVFKDVVRMRGLSREREVPAGAMGKEELREYMQREIRRDFPDSKFEELSRAWAVLGLVPDGTDLRTDMLDLLQGQVAGFYDPRTKRFYLVTQDARADDGGMGAQMEAMLRQVGLTGDHVTMAHELTHALQDQHYDLLHGVHDLKDEDDRVLAAKCVVEGDATLLMKEYLLEKMVGGLPIPEESKPRMHDMLRTRFAQQADQQTLESMAAQQPNLAGKPRALWVPLIYPYLGGERLCRRAFTSGGWKAVDKFFADLPASTEQVLHPDKYFVERDAPVRVRLGELPALAGWKVLEENTLGELMMRVWLRQQGAAEAVANRAAAGWGGDRFRCYTQGDGRTVAVLATTWDTTQDASEFLQAYGGRGRTAAKGLHVLVVHGGDAELQQRVLAQAMAALTIGGADRPAPAADGRRVQADGFSFTHPGDDWQVQEIGHVGKPAELVYDHAGVRGARIVVTGRGPADDATRAVRRVMDALRAAGGRLDNVHRLRVGDTSDTSCEARFTTGGFAYVLVADVVDGRLVTVLGRTPRDIRGGAGPMPRTVQAARRIAKGLRAE